MFVCEKSEKIFQTLPGQGWRVLIQWNPDEADVAEGFPKITEEPVIAWVTAKVSRETMNTRTQQKHEYEEVVITPLVRYPDGHELTLLDDRGHAQRRWIYLAPGEERTPQHIERLRLDGYTKGISVE